MGMPMTQTARGGQSPQKIYYIAEDEDEEEDDKNAVIGTGVRYFVH
jgi:hypothetical protein